MNPEFDVAAAHKYFAVHCFNATWDLMDKPQRSAEEDQMMSAMSQAAIFHWRSRPDCTDQNLSVGYWQASRVQVMLGQAGDARRWAEICLGYSQHLPAFYLGYACEAMARAALLAGNTQDASQWANQARQHASQVTDPDERAMLDKDLATLP